MNYQKVIEDFNNGTIDPKKWQVTMDNDGGYWSCLDHNMGDEKREELEKEMEQKYGVPDGYRDIVKVLEGAGVTADWC
jgi:hypothetical protein